MRIAFQGAPGAYSEMAAQRAWPAVETVPCEHFEDVFASVAAGKSSHGLLPIENSVGGSIHRNYDLLLEHDLPIVAETELQVVHNLIALPGTELAQIRRVCSHPQALAQCEQFLRRLSGVEIVATYDTAGSARLIRDQKLTDTAAVASTRARVSHGGFGNRPAKNMLYSASSCFSSPSRRRRSRSRSWAATGVSGESGTRRAEARVLARPAPGDARTARGGERR